MPPADPSRPDDHSASPSAARLRAWMAALRPAPVRIDAAERWRASGGAALGVLLTGLAGRALAGDGPGLPWLVAPLGASAVLVFGVPSSPLATPWAVVGGNTLSALVGIACALLVPDPVAAGALAVGLAIALMLALRCLHPPGGASALFAVLAHTADWRFALFPVLTNSLVLVACGMLYGRWSGRPYPHRPMRPPADAPEADAGGTRSRFAVADLDAALARHNRVIDVDRDDLQALLAHAEAAAYQRNLGALRCADIMTRAPVAVEFGTPLREAWALMRRRGIKALPVIDRARRVAGIVTVADFLREADLDTHEGLAARLRDTLRAIASSHADRPEVVGQIMTRRVRVASDHRPAADLVPLFSEGGHHHIPVIDGERRLVGIITQTELVRALARAVRPGDPP
jgi:CBS domain-containing membrane protein